MKRINSNLPDSLYEALMERMETTRPAATMSALSQCLGTPFTPCFRCRHRRRSLKGFTRARFGSLGCYVMAILVSVHLSTWTEKWSCWRACVIGWQSDGTVSTVDGDRLIPYAVVTRFTVEFAKRSQQLNSFSELVAVCDALRSSENVVLRFPYRRQSSPS